MTIFVVTDSKAVRRAFETADRSKSFTVDFHSSKKLTEAIREADATPDSFLYVDVGGLDRRALKRRLTRFRDERPFRFGIIDLKHDVVDIAEVFHHCAADYVGKGVLGEGMSTARLRRVVEFDPGSNGDRPQTHVPEHENHTIIPSGSDWSAVRDGQEYTFIMIYAGLERGSGLDGKESEGYVTALRKAFVSLLEQSFLEYEARVWMWKEEEGLLLLPFDGQEIDAIVPALRLVLNHELINAEELASFGRVDWRLAIHLGNTTYRSSGRTGAIVAESVNFLFHLGARFVESGGLAVTAPALRFIPQRTLPLLDHRGEFESIHVYTLRDLLSGGS